MRCRNRLIIVFGRAGRWSCDVHVWLFFFVQNSELELDTIEVDPETKEMLKSLVRVCCEGGKPNGITHLSLSPPFHRTLAISLTCK